MELQAEQNKYKLLTARLTEIEKNYLGAFLENPEMVNAIEKVLTYSIYQMGVVKEGDAEMGESDVNWAYALVANPALSDEQVGRELKAKANGLSYLDDAFKQIKKFKVEKAESNEEINPAL